MNISSRQSIRLVVEKIFPRDPEVRAKALNALDRQPAPLLQFAGHAAGAVTWGYIEQFAKSFNEYAALAQAAVVVICFALAPPHAALYALGAVLVALSFRDAFTHQKNPLSEAQYYLDSAGDAAAAGVFVIVSQGLAAVALPSMALPAQVMYRGLLVSMPLIATLRLVLRPKGDGCAHPSPDSRPPSSNARAIYRKTRWLNFLWLVTFYGVVAHSVTDVPHYFPDFLRGFLPVVTFGVWKASQVDDLCRRDNLVTLFTNIKAKALRRMRGKVAVGVARDNVNYSTFMFFQGLLFGLMALALLGAVEPFLFGEPLMQSVWQAAGALLAFMACALSWKHVKASNRAAARALLQEARREEANAN
jgi:hypothetical protein